LVVGLVGSSLAPGFRSSAFGLVIRIHFELTLVLREPEAATVR